MTNTDLLSSDAQSAASRADHTSQAGSDHSPATSSAAAQSAVVAPSSDQAGETSSNGASPRRRGGLSGMVLADLRQLAGEIGIGDTTGMRKGDLIAAIKERQGGGKPAGTPTTIDAAPEQPAAKATGETASNGTTPRDATAGGDTAAPVTEAQPEQAQAAPRQRGRQSDAGAPNGDTEGGERRPRRRRSGGRNTDEDGNRADSSSDSTTTDRPQRGGRDNERNNDRNERNERGGRDRNNDRNDRNDRANDRGNDRNDRANDRANDRDDDDDDGGRRRGRRFRDRRRNRGRGEGGPAGGGGNEPEVREDDVLLPVAGILDVLDNYAFVRTTGYLAGPNDVYVSLSLVRKYGLRRGDAIAGVVRQPRENEQQRQKFNPLVRVDKINGFDPEEAKGRKEFHKLTPLYPNERLRLETEPNILTTRIIDLVMPIGKGQRALIVSPPKAGKTSVLQAIANAITTNNPECHLMVVLVDERPEEVTDMERTVKGEVIASTFDRPPADHTTVAELSIERAKRLVEMGYDVVVLLDSITRLGRAYNLAAPASGRILSGGVDSTALYPPKRFLGAARNIEGGGSLTIFATALVETGSTMDTVIFEEFKGTGNAELKLDRKIADRRVFPAVDVNPSSTRKEELLLSPDEMAVTHKLRRVLQALDSQQAIDLLLEQLRKTRTNIEFLMQVSKSTPGRDD